MSILDGDMVYLRQASNELKKLEEIFNRLSDRGTPKDKHDPFHIVTIALKYISNDIYYGFLTRTSGKKILHDTIEFLINQRLTLDEIFKVLYGGNKYSIGVWKSIQQSQNLSNYDVLIRHTLSI